MRGFIEYKQSHDTQNNRSSKDEARECPVQTVDVGDVDGVGGLRVRHLPTIDGQTLTLAVRKLQKS